MTWILILTMYCRDLRGGTAISTANFTTQRECLRAAGIWKARIDKLQNGRNPDGVWGDMPKDFATDAVCVEGGTK